MDNLELQISCILSKFYIKPQPAISNVASANGCILSKFYIKPQPRTTLNIFPVVVSYRNSTSNHNNNFTNDQYSLLYLIEILHQTTTTLAANGDSSSCILSKFYIKPQLISSIIAALASCILSKFYIKPQHACSCFRFFRVVSYRNSTSNHNCTADSYLAYWLYLIEILHQTTTQAMVILSLLCCILSKFYIKPQQQEARKKVANGCILSKFYIKPQQSSNSSAWW